MKITLKTRNFDSSEGLQGFVEKKFNTLSKFIKRFEGAEIMVELEKETNHHRKGDVFMAESMVQVPGKNLVSKAKSDDLFKAIVEAKDELKAEIEKYKFKKIDKNRREQRKSKEEFKV